MHDVRPDRSTLLVDWGVHGWAGRWLVNGSRSGIVRIDIDPACRAWVLGLPVRLTTVKVSLAEPDAFCATVGAALARVRGRAT